MNRKKILFLSTTNLTSNPRVLKEINYALSLEFEVSFIGFVIGNWSDRLEQEHISNFVRPINIHYLDATRKSYFTWLLSSIIELICRKLYIIFPKKLFMNAFAHNKRSWLLLNYLNKNIQDSTNLIVAHTLGALYPAYTFSRKREIQFAFDIEDFHPGESITSDVENEKLRRIFLMKQILPKAKYVSTASPLISKEIRNWNLFNLITINNAFESKEFIKPVLKLNGNNKKLRFIWFSQNISFGRGLEVVIPILKYFSNEISLELIGKLDIQLYDEVIYNHLNWITIKEPMAQIDLHHYLSNFDIGLALEMNHADYNREIALTNKVIAYYQAGLYIFATDTKAQVAFLNDKKNHGLCASQNQKSLEISVRELIENKNLIINEKSKRFESAKSLNWESESIKLKSFW